MNHIVTTCYILNLVLYGKEENIHPAYSSEFGCCLNPTSPGALQLAPLLVRSNTTHDRIE